MNKQVLRVVCLALFVTSAFTQCTPETLDATTVEYLPPASEVSLSFGDGSILDVNTNVEQTSPVPRDNFAYIFAHPTTSISCALTTATVGADYADTDSSCLVPVSSTFQWPPEANCFSKTTGSTSDTYRSKLELAWEEDLTVSGVSFTRNVTVQFSVAVDLPTAIVANSTFVSSSTSTVDFIVGFLIDQLSFDMVSSTVVDFNILLPTLTTKDGSKELEIVSFLALDAGSATEQGTGVSTSDLYKQIWLWSITTNCSGLSGSYSFRAQFACTSEGSGNAGCSDADYLGQFQDIVVTITASSVCPSTSVDDFKAIATMTLNDGNGLAKSTFSNLDSIKASISSITNQDILVSTTVSTVTVNSNAWTEGDEYTVDTTDPIHPIIVFDSISGLMNTGKLNNDGGVTSNEIVVDLALVWNDGSVAKRSVEVLRQVSQFPSSTQANKNFAIVSANVEHASSAATTGFAVALPLALIASVLL